MEKEKNLIVEKSFDFALQIIELYKTLAAKHEYVLSKQVLRSGTSIGANIEEAIAGHSKKDFLARMIIAHKEARETRYWLRLLERSNIGASRIQERLSEITDIINILTAIISTSKRKLGITTKLFLWLFAISLSYRFNVN